MDSEPMLCAVQSPTGIMQVPGQPQFVLLLLLFGGSDRVSEARQKKHDIVHFFPVRSSAREHKLMFFLRCIVIAWSAPAAREGPDRAAKRRGHGNASSRWAKNVA